jgi:hypothetical protein
MLGTIWLEAKDLNFSLVGDGLISTSGYTFHRDNYMIHIIHILE